MLHLILALQENNFYNLFILLFLDYSKCYLSFLSKRSYHDLLWLPSIHNKLLRSKAWLILHLIPYITTLSSSFSFSEIIWHNHLTNIENSFPILLVIKKTRGVSEPCSTFEILDLQSPLLVFIQFKKSFECFVFMALNNRIKKPYIEKCCLFMSPKPSCTDISLRFHRYVSTYWLFFSS